jgi:hypothetical protein
MGLAARIVQAGHRLAAGLHGNPGADQLRRRIILKYLLDYQLGIDDT